MDVGRYRDTAGYQGYGEIWLYLDAEVLVLPPVFYPQDSCFVGRRLFVVNQLAARGTTARLD